MTYVIETERKLHFHRFLRRHIKESKTITPNAKKAVCDDIREGCFSFLWGVLRYDSREGINRVKRYHSQKV